MSGGTIVAYCHGGNIRHEWMLCRDKLLERPDVVGEVVAQGAYIPENRNLLAQHFLATDCEWMYSLDIDIRLRPETLDVLRAVARPGTHPVVSALYFVQYNDTPPGSWWPCWLEERPESEVAIVSQVRLGELRELTACGMGAALIHRSVFEKLRGLTDDPWPYYGNDIVNGRRAGEDVTFCRRARAAGFSVWGVAHVVEHMKTVPIGWNNFVSQFTEEVRDALVQPRLLPRPGEPLPLDPHRNRAERRHQPKGLRPRG